MFCFIWKGLKLSKSCKNSTQLLAGHFSFDKYIPTPFLHLCTSCQEGICHRLEKSPTKVVPCSDSFHFQRLLQYYSLWQLWSAANRKYCLWQNPNSRRSKYNFLLSHISACTPAEVSFLHLDAETSKKPWTLTLSRTVGIMTDPLPFNGKKCCNLCKKSLSWGSWGGIG